MSFVCFFTTACRSCERKSFPPAFELTGKLGELWTSVHFQFNSWASLGLLELNLTDIELKVVRYTEANCAQKDTAIWLLNFSLNSDSQSFQLSHGLQLTYRTDCKLHIDIETVTQRQCFSYRKGH